MKIKRLRYNRRKVFLGLFLFLCLLGVTLGYAFVTTKLTIDGTATVKDAKWDIHFDNYTATTGSVTPTTSPTITDTTITFAAKLEDPGDFYGFTIDVENEGTINADISNISVTPDFSNIAYIDSTITYSDDTPIQVGDILAANRTKTIKVLLEYKDGINENLYPTTDQSISVTISLSYEQYTGTVPANWILPSGKTASTLSVGDEICLDEQCFNFIKYDGNDVVMLAKYNLKVGNIYNSSYIKTGEYTSSDIGYGLQSSEIRGYVDGSTSHNGIVAFSYTNYWNSLVTYPVDIYDSSYTGLPGTSTYSVAYYVEQYKNKLTSDYNATIKSARLLTYAEATDSSIGCVSEDSCPTTGTSAFITNTSFWLGSAYSDDSMWYINSDGTFYSDDAFFRSNEFGVRPVIVVTKTELD